jgi:hypothetical protein
MLEYGMMLQEASDLCTRAELQDKLLTALRRVAGLTQELAKLREQQVAVYAFDAIAIN